MATLKELRKLFGDGDLRNKIETQVAAVLDFFADGS